MNERVIELTNEIGSNRVGDMIKFAKAAAKLGLIYAAVCSALIAWDWGCAKYHELRSELLISELQRELGDYEITVDHKKSVVITPESGKPEQLKKALYLALLQLELQSDALSNIKVITEAQEVSGVKVVEE